MSNNNFRQVNEQSREIWDINAAFWNQRMGEGNDFVQYLIWPATERLLELKTGEEVLDIACGNGLASRKLSAMGAKVTAFDFSQAMIAAAKSESSAINQRIDYLQLDVTDSTALLDLGAQRFDAAHCGMALFDIADIDPLFQALPKLLKPEGRFVFSLLHPCFNGGRIAQIAEMEDHDGEITTRYCIKVWGYMTPTISRGIGIPGQPEPQYYFHRPLQEIFKPLFRNGFILDGFEERAFPPDYQGGTFPLSWNGNYSEIPPVLVARAKLR